MLSLPERIIFALAVLLSLYLNFSGCHPYHPHSPTRSRQT